MIAPERTAAIRLATARFCLQLGWAPLHEVTLANGRRADILALRPDGGFVCIEVKSGPADFLADAKWTAYSDFSDTLYFAVDSDFPQNLLPIEAGLIVTAGTEAALLRDGPHHPMSPTRRRALTLRFASLAANRLAAATDPVGASVLRAALRAE